MTDKKGKKGKSLGFDPLAWMDDDAPPAVEAKSAPEPTEAKPAAKKAKPKAASKAKAVKSRKLRPMFQNLA